MWHNPRLMNLTANALYGVAVFIVLCIAVIATVNSRLFPLHKINLQGDLAHVDATLVAAVLEGRVTGNFFGVDLQDVRDALQDMPWVRRVHIRRQWPDTLVAVVEAHRPLARWNDSRLVSVRGELFDGETAAALPRFTGPQGSEATVTARFREFERLVGPLAMRITHLELSPRHAWQLRLAGEDGTELTLLLGREHHEQSAVERLARFVDVYPQTLGQFERRTAQVDLRYPNGFALRVPGIEKFESQRGKAGSA